MTRHAVPLAWFLPGPVCMRGGVARHFASGRHFHRGIQAEATCRTILEKATHYQRLAESRSWRAGFFCGSHPTRSQPAEATCEEAIESACIFRLTKLPPLIYPLIIEDLRPGDSPRGRSRFYHIADPVSAVGIAQRASARPPAPNENRPWTSSLRRARSRAGRLTSCCGSVVQIV